MYNVWRHFKFVEMMNSNTIWLFDNGKLKKKDIIKYTCTFLIQS